MTDPIHKELSDLCQSAVEGNLDLASEKRLNELIASDDAACTFYVDYLEVHALLTWRHGAVEPLEIPLAVNQPTKTKKLAARHLLASAAAVVLSVCGIVILLAAIGRAPWSVVKQEPIAVVLGDEDVEWAGSVSHNGKRELAPGRQQIDAGTARIELTNGVLLAAAGPCEFELTAADHLHLYRGKVNIYSPLATRGFTVTTPRGVQVVDLGTHFGVWVDQSEAVHVHLFEGRLLVNNRTEMQTGEAVIVDTSGKLRQDTANGRLFPPLHHD